jgi:DNA-binding CsgD family transcriptional regulator
MIEPVPKQAVRGVGDVIRACYGPSQDWSRTRDRLLAQLRKSVAVDAAFVATADPETLLFSSAWADEPLRPSAPAFLDNEFGACPDVNRFADLARAAHPARTHADATRGDRVTSERWRTLMAPIGLGEELRVALRIGEATWGFMCLHRDHRSPFTAAEVSALEQIAPHAAVAARRTTATLASPERRHALVVAHDDVVVSCSPGGIELLEDIDRPVELGEQLPVVLRAVVRRLEAIERDPDRSPEPASAIVTTRRGSLLMVHATRLLGRAGTDGVALTLTPPTSVSLAGIRLAAHGLTPAQVRVAKLVLQGRSTREIMANLRISQYTVQDHLKAIFDRTGVRSRRELVAALMH